MIVLVVAARYDDGGAVAVVKWLMAPMVAALNAGRGRGTTASRSTLVEYPDQLDEYGVPRDCDVVATLGPKVLKLSAERSAGVRKLFRLVQLEQVAERIVQEGLVPGAGDERDPVHLNALLPAGR